MTAVNTEVIDVRKETALYLINKINTSATSKELWNAVRLHALLSNKIHEPLNESIKFQFNNLPATSYTENGEYSNPSFVPYNTRCYEKRLIIENVILSLNQTITASHRKVKFFHPEKISPGSIGFQSLLSDSGYYSEEVNAIPNLIEIVFNYVLDNSVEPEYKSSVGIQKCLCVLKNVTKHEEASGKLIDLISSTLKSESMNHNEDMYSNYENIFKVIKTICNQDNEDILLQISKTVVNEIALNIPADNRCYRKLSKMFYLIDLLRSLLSDYEMLLNKRIKDPQVSIRLSHDNMKTLLISTFKEMKIACSQCIKSLKKYWVLSLVVLNLQGCLIIICDIIKLLHSINS